MKKVVLSAALLYACVSGFSQTPGENNLNKVRFGFNLGAGYSNLQLKAPSSSGAVVNNNFGGSIGIFMDYPVSDHFIISTEADVSFNECKVEFTDQSADNTTYPVFPYSLDFMVHMKYKPFTGKLSPYLLAGPNIKIPIKNQSGSTTGYPTGTDFGIDFGIGLEIKSKYFILAPELRYSLGLLNINQHPDVESLNFNKISLILNFK